MDLQQSMVLCHPLSPGVGSNSCPLSWWCFPTISFSVTFSFCLQSLPASGSFPMNQLFAPDGQSFSFSIIPSNEYSWLISFRIDWLDLLAVQRTLKSLLSLALQFKNINSSALSLFMVQVSHPSMTTGKIIALTIWTFVAKWCLSFLIQRLGLS